MKIRDVQRSVYEWCVEYRPKKHRTPEFLFAHLHEECSEAWKEWREGRMTAYTTLEAKHGGEPIPKPEGLPAELAVVMIMAMIIAEMHDIDLERAIRDKRMYLNRKLDAKHREKASRGR